MEKLLFIDACVSVHQSRTKKLCATYIREFLKKYPEVELETLDLSREEIKPLLAEDILLRDQYVLAHDWQQPIFKLARQFREADCIVIGTPYWDLSFVSLLKIYIENIMVVDLTFSADTMGFHGLCNGKKLVYITTAGGFIQDKNFGYDYICAIANMLGVKETEFISAEALDIDGFDVDVIMEAAEKEIISKFTDKAE